MSRTSAKQRPRPGSLRSEDAELVAAAGPWYPSAPTTRRPTRCSSVTAR
jgi:hypothetical protein